MELYQLRVLGEIKEALKTHVKMHTEDCMSVFIVNRTHTASIERVRL